MAEITAALVMELREATNLSMMECKKALVESEGDKDKAIRILRERGLAVAQKKASRAANQGLVASVIKPDGKVGSLVEVNCETDFVARNASFVEFVNRLAEKACDTDKNLADLEKAAIVAKVQQVGENLILKQNARFVLSGPGALVSYIHLGGKIGILVEAGCTSTATAQNAAFKEAVKDVAMHIAATNPPFLSRDSVTKDVIAAERGIYAKQVENKPANIVEKIVDGKMKKFFADSCLLEQPFVKEPKQTVTDYLAARSKEAGDTITIRRFLRYQIGVNA